MRIQEMKRRVRQEAKRYAVKEYEIYEVKRTWKNEHVRVFNIETRSKEKLQYITSTVPCDDTVYVNYLNNKFLKQWSIYEQ